MSQLKAYSQLLDEVIDLGSPTENLDDLLQLGDFMATGRPGIIVYVEGPALRKWTDAEDT